MFKIALVTNDCPAYLNDVLCALDKYDFLKVNGLRASQLCKIEKENPELFAKISEKISEGRWYPFAGMWQDEEDFISDERLARQILYSEDWLHKKFGKIFRSFCGKKVCSKTFAQIVYSGRFDCAVLSDENENYWLDGAKDGFRIFVMSDADKADVKDIDLENAKECCFETYNEMLHRSLSMPLALRKAKVEVTDDFVTDAEKAVLAAEKISAQSFEDKSEEIRECWFDIFAGNEDEAAKKAAEIADGRECADIVKINKSGVEVSVFKFAEDKSGDKVIRLKETAGEEKNISVMCDEINAGFRCEIDPYEIATYRIDAEGFVREKFIFE